LQNKLIVKIKATMFESLIKLVKEHAGDAIVKNPAIPNEKNDAAINTAATSIMDQLKSLMANGGVEKIMNMFKDGNILNNPEVKNITNKVAEELKNKFGIDSNQAGGIVKNMVPDVMTNLVKKTNDPDDKSFDLQGILHSLTGGDSKALDGLMEKAKSFLQK
jgi:Bacterial protein of unknown function (DUF937)